MINDVNLSSPSPRRIRLVILTITLMLVDAGGALNSLQTPPALIEQTSLLPALELIASVFWTLVFVYVALKLWQRTPESSRLLGWALIGRIGYSLVRLTVFVRADYDRERLPVLWLAGLIGGLLLWIFLVRSAPPGAAHTEINDNE